MAMKGTAVPVFRRPDGQAEAGPIIRRANDPMTELNIACAIMVAFLADGGAVGKPRRTPIEDCEPILAAAAWTRMALYAILSDNLGKWHKAMNTSKLRHRRKASKPPPPPAIGTTRVGFSDETFEPYSGGEAVVSVISSDNIPNVPTVRATPGALADLARHGYSDEEISALVVSRRTLARRRAADEPLSVEETDKALRLERIAALAERVFGDPKKAYRWLRKPKNLLDGATPVAFLASESGARQVEEMLYRIQHGMFA
jgi:putative toxin-antitoxin system antitoxin component (TIGR02293 family)